jgi:AraC family transcriptional regulator of adaptative response/methylated-DNA-[protein]-cysteine methyltransferase
MQTEICYPMPSRRSIPASIASLPHTRTANQPDADARWQQVLARDPLADGRFVYAVRSTKIYCRPTCPSRRPARAGVDFFLTAADAERAGFRACKRCKPDQSAMADPYAAAAAEVARRLARSSGNTVPLTDLARELNIPRLTLLRAFRRIFGVTPSEFARARRMDRFRDSVTSASDSPRITDAIYSAGFGSSSRLYEKTANRLGMKPRALRAGAPGVAILYTTAASPLGRVLVAATEQGICAIVFGQSDAELLADLRGRFPRAELNRAKSAGGWLADAVACIASQTTEHPLAASFPLDVRATAFQHRVWKELQRIPRGETRSYAEVARKLGRPTATRAVARAIATNPLAIVVPCHRVIGSDGSLTGYRWGIERKKKLLAAEGVARCGVSSDREP